MDLRRNDNKNERITNEVKYQLSVDDKRQTVNIYNLIYSINI